MWARLLSVEQPGTVVGALELVARANGGTLVVEGGGDDAVPARLSLDGFARLDYAGFVTLAAERVAEAFCVGLAYEAAYYYAVGHEGLAGYEGDVPVNGAYVSVVDYGACALALYGLYRRYGHLFFGYGSDYHGRGGLGGGGFLAHCALVGFAIGAVFRFTTCHYYQ